VELITRGKEAIHRVRRLLDHEVTATTSIYQT
jgi:hypothetical protein